MNAVGTLGRSSVGTTPSHQGALDHAALVLGRALVAWSERRSARALEPIDGTELMIARAAQLEGQRVLAERHAGANHQLYRMH